MIRRYPNEPNKAIAASLGVSEPAVRNQAQRLELVKAKDHRSNSMLGNKRGSVPKAKKPIGNFRIRNGYLYVRLTVTDKKYEDYVAVHHLVWELHNGAIPEGYNVFFKDGNTENITPENLELVSRAEAMKRNTYLRLPEEIRQVVHLTGTITQVINHRKKQNI